MLLVFSIKTDELFLWKKKKMIATNAFQNASDEPNPTPRFIIDP